MNTYPAAVLGCPRPDGYGVTEGPAFDTQDGLKGRPRSRLRDTLPSTQFSLKFDFSDSQFNGWQSWWASLRGGTDWFTINLIVDVISGTDFECHALKPWSSQRTKDGRWVVTLDVEGVAVP